MNEENISIDIKRFGYSLILYSSVIMLCVSFIFGIILIFNGGNYGIGVILMFSISLTNIVLFFFKKFEIAISIFHIGGILVLCISAYIQESAVVFAAIGVILIMSSIMKSMRFTTGLFIFTFIVMVLYVFLDKFTFVQQLDSERNIPLANNIQVPSVILIFSYLFAYVNTKILLRTINNLRDQNKTIQDTQNLLISQARIDSVQLLAGGFAHDFNNILTGIMGNISLVLDNESLEIEDREYLNDAQKASFQAKNLANQLLSFSKNRKQEIIKNVRLSDILENTVNFCLSGKKSSAILEFDEDFFGFDGDPIQIGQVVQNLVINADQSMVNGGIIRVVGKNLTLTQNNPYNLPPGNFLKVSIFDHGEGVPEYSREKLFNPFFSTKKKGTGLGLAIAKSIISNHQGFLNYKSELGRGSEFYFILPGKVLSAHIDQEKLDFRKNYSGLSLILDDNLNVLTVMKNMLRAFGLQSICISESSSFINKLKELVEKNNSPNIVILDLTMPGDQGGKDLIDQVRKISPHAYIVVSSGYSDDFVMENYQDFGFDNILRKPYTKDELGEILNTYFSQISNKKENQL